MSLSFHCGYDFQGVPTVKQITITDLFSQTHLVRSATAYRGFRRVPHTFSNPDQSGGTTQVCAERAVLHPCRYKCANPELRGLIDGNKGQLHSEHARPDKVLANSTNMLIIPSNKLPEH